MEIEVLSKKKNELLQRVELEFKVSHPNEGSPKRDAVRTALAKMENAAKELVIIDNLRSEYGLTSTTGFAKIYKEKEAVMSLERKYILIRNGLIAAEKKEAKKKEAPPKPKEAEPTEKPKEKEEKKPEAEKPKQEEKKTKKDEPKKEEASEKSKK
jgi:small subunit ribosomal protein S24e